MPPSLNYSTGIEKGPLSINGIFDEKSSKNGVYTEGSFFKNIKPKKSLMYGYTRLFY
jgi:hypothetical protein